MNKNGESGQFFDRRDAMRYMLGLMAAAGADPQLLDAWMQDAHHLHENAGGNGSNHKYRPIAEGAPAFFDGGELSTLTRMVDLIIPKTDTPGAADAGVALYIDIVVNSDHALGDKFRRGLKQLDEASLAAAKKTFSSARESEQISLLNAMLPKTAPGNDFFETVKAMTIVGYYSSEIGLFQELHFKGNEALATFPGCPHGGHPLAMHAKRPGIAVLIDDTTRKWPFPTSDNVTGEDL